MQLKKTKLTVAEALTYMRPFGIIGVYIDNVCVWSKEISNKSLDPDEELRAIEINRAQFATLWRNTTPIANISAQMIGPGQAIIHVETENYFGDYE